MDTLAQAFAHANLSERYKDIIRRLLDGESYSAISKALNIREHTLKNYAYEAFTRLGFTNKDQLLERLEDLRIKERTCGEDAEVFSYHCPDRIRKRKAKRLRDIHRGRIDG